MMYCSGCRMFRWRCGGEDRLRWFPLLIPSSVVAVLFEELLALLSACTCLEQSLARLFLVFCFWPITERIFKSYTLPVVLRIIWRILWPNEITYIEIETNNRFLQIHVSLGGLGSWIETEFLAIEFSGFTGTRRENVTELISLVLNSFAERLRTRWS